MSIEAMKQALEALEDLRVRHVKQSMAITALRQAIAEEALNKKAENARELGLTYEQESVAHQYWCASLTQLLLSNPPKPAPCNCRPPKREADKQEPVAWANPSDLQNFDMKVRTHGGPLHSVPLYTHPPKREAEKQEPVAWVERWHGSGASTGWWIWEKGLTHGNAIAYIGIGPFAEKLTSIIVEKHNSVVFPTQPEKEPFCPDPHDPTNTNRPQPPKRVVFPTMLRKMWSGTEVQAWLDEHVNKEKNT